MARALAAVGNLTLLPAAAALPAAGAAVALPGVRTTTVAVEQALARRRSVRAYSPRPVPLAAVAQLLWAAQGITGSGGRRTAPSAGALYPLEIHLVAARVEGLAAGAYRYLPADHALRPARRATAVSALQRAALGQAAVGAAAAVVVVAAVEQRTAGKYGARAARYVAFEAGAAAQGLAVQAAALGIGCVVIGAFDDAALARALRLPGGEQPVVLIPVGVPA